MRPLQAKEPDSSLALIIHGAYGTPKENWFPWLAQELNNRGFNPIVPQFPTPENQNLAAWQKVAEPLLSLLDNHSIIAGHSIGATFALSILEKLTRPIDAAILVSGFVSNIPDKNLNAINSSFYDKPFDWPAIRHNAHRFIQFHSHDDPFVPEQNAEELANHLGVKPIYIPNAGHFNTKSGFAEFPQLIESLGMLD